MARLNLSIPDELNNSLAWSAKNLDRSKGYIVRKAIEYYLQEMQEDMEDTKKIIDVTKYFCKIHYHRLLLLKFFQ
ncbi:MAG: ribbon-helix-helix domain-containing protein [Rickettsia endosymbiont of Sceptobius lativentris]|nr:ribbon-helix-helix domain-containing protein [Rickettsia endosymbiont of Sceptobius lativentris]